VFQEEQETFGF